ncbi:MAG TPA: S8 family serine peptidase [Roseiarcus sp.]|nr:S8 family serine peptidase [Roseiarcus sp.]
MQKAIAYRLNPNPLFALMAATVLALAPGAAGAEGSGSGGNFPVVAPTAPQPQGGEPPAPRKHQKAATPKAPAPVPRTVSHGSPPPAGETRLRPSEAVVEFPLRIPATVIEAIRARHRLVEVESTEIALLGDNLRLWRAPDGRAAAALVRELGAEPQVANVQANYVYALQDDAGAAPSAASAQYALAKLHVDATRGLATGDNVLVAMIDTGVDETHPDLKGAIEARTDTIGGTPSALGHGTSIAGAIGARGTVEGVAPKARILAARAFESTPSGPQGTTLSIVKSVDWAAQAKARLINMSFAGPQDPDVHRVLTAAADKGVALIAAAGNGGPKSPAFYPAADARVIAVTAIDADDRLFENANRGAYIALAAPGVDVLLPAPNGGYDLQTGTSVAAALVSGVAALVLERNPALNPDALKKTLMSTTKPLGGSGHEAEFGAGLVDAARALGAEKSAAKTQ